MKPLLLILFLFQSLIGFSQTTTTTLHKTKIGFVLSCKNDMEINKSSNDTTFTVFCSFQNQQYQHITDIGSVFIMNKEKLNKTIDELKECLKYMDKKSMNFSIGPFSIYDFSKNLYINDDEKYTTLNKKGVLKWIEWLERCIVE